MLNRGTARHPLVMHALRWLFWLSVTHGFHLTGRYIPGATNIAADSASRLLELGQWARLTAHLPPPQLGFTPPEPRHLQHITDCVLNYCYSNRRPTCSLTSGSSAGYGGPLRQMRATPLEIFQMCSTPPRNISNVQHTTSKYLAIR